MSTEHSDLLVRMTSLGAHLVALASTLKRPINDGWPLARALSVEDAETHLDRGGNVGVNLAASGLICLDAENFAATGAVTGAGFVPTVIPAKSQTEHAIDPAKDKRGGTHTWLRVPDGIDPWTLRSDRTGITLSNGGTIDVLAGHRQAVAPPSQLAEAPGYAYAAALGGPLDPSSGVADIAVAPMWLFDPQVPGCPAELSVLNGILAPKTAYERVEADARSQELTDRIDEIPWGEWLDGDQRLIPAGQIDTCGCEVYHWYSAEHGKSATLHDGCDKGCGIHVWSGTMIGELRLDNDHLSRLNLAAKLRGVSVQVAAASVGITLGGGNGEELAPVRPDHYEESAREATQRGETARAAMFRKAAAVLRATGPDIEAGEIGSHSRIGGGGAPIPPQRPATFTYTVVEGGGEGGDAPRPPLSAVPPIFTVLFSDPVTDDDTDPLPPPLLAGDPGPFPVYALPKVLREHCEWVMAAKAVPASMVAPMYLPLLSAACGRAIIVPRAEWIEFGPIWICVVAPPSSRKSPTLNAVKAPLESAQRILRDRREQVRLAAEAMADATGESLEEAKQEYQKACKIYGASIPHGMMLVAEPDELRELREHMEHLRKLAAEATAAIPPDAQLAFDDATDAALEEHLKDTGGYAFMLAPEGSRWFDALLDPRNSTTTSGVYLDLYDGGKRRSKRIGRGTTEVDNCYLPMLVVIQPEPLKASLKPDRDGRRRLIGDGTASRMGMAIVERVEPDTFNHPQPEDTGANARYEQAVEREFLRSFGREDPIRFELDTEARKVFAPIYDRVERVKVEAADRSTSDGMAEAWGKAAGRALRIARVFTQIGMTDAELAAPGVKLISAESITNAWAIAEWFLASAAYGMGGTAPVTDEQLHGRCLKWLRKRLAKEGAVEFRRLHDNARHRPYLRAAIDELVAAGEVAVSDGPISSATVTATATLQRSA
ncbi:hypothetical protein C5U48_02775 [Mycolicibacter virginiensis]|uniref:DNA primase/polymerase bifunctional N-terminal domain-containing protein n=1 Tax=Mycolicibacter virginiensis TaxID=1795032 RepID=A0A9X7IQX9_9MYCO|nr:DUF3987 domain-containing protein [Mycolicibacter virginiensis]PQM53747.1 hypothetical protein C5U48_02775 [Mycolicibacter virginiensis]